MDNCCYYCDKEETTTLIKSPCTCKHQYLHKNCYYIIRQQRKECFYCKGAFPPLVYEWSDEGLAKIYKFKNMGDTIYRYEFTVNRSMEKHGVEKIYDDIRGTLIATNTWLNGLKIISEEGM
jgi:hypothetical protein